LEQLERIATAEARIDNLIDWQNTQNGCLRRMENKVDSLHKLIIGLMGGMITSLVLLALNLILKN